MFHGEGSETGGSVEMAPFGFQNMNSFNIVLNIAVDTGKLAFQILHLILHDEHTKIDQTGKSYPKAQSCTFCTIHGRISFLGLRVVIS